jgi:hypothetical protein
VVQPSSEALSAPSRSLSGESRIEAIARPGPPESHSVSAAGMRGVPSERVDRPDRALRPRDSGDRIQAESHEHALETADLPRRSRPVSVAVSESAVECRVSEPTSETCPACPPRRRSLILALSVRGALGVVVQSVGGDASRLSLESARTAGRGARSRVGSVTTLVTRNPPDGCESACFNRFLSVVAATLNPMKSPSLRGTSPIQRFVRTRQAAFSCSWFESRYPSSNP